MRFELITPHYMHDAYLEAGTIIGDGTRWPVPYNKAGDPALSMNMTPLDEEAKAALEKHGDKWAGKEIPLEIQQHPRGLSPGQRIGGEGPKPTGDQILHPAGQGPRDSAGNQIVGNDATTNRESQPKSAEQKGSTGVGTNKVPSGISGHPENKKGAPIETKVEEPNKDQYPKG